MEKAEKVVFKFDVQTRNGDDRFYLAPLPPSVKYYTTNLREAQDFVEELNPKVEDLEISESGEFITYIESVSYERVSDD
jgi:hypothetical protein